MENEKNKYLYHPKVRDAHQLGSVLDAAKKQRPEIKVGFANGKFLNPHVGHSVFLQLCKNECSLLVVGVNSDYSLIQSGFNKPKFSHRERGFQLACMEAVDYVIFFDEETPVKVLSLINPDFVLKGPDYTEDKVIALGREVKIIKHPFVEVHSSNFKYFEVPQ